LGTGALAALIGALVLAAWLVVGLQAESAIAPRALGLLTRAIGAASLLGVAAALALKLRRLLTLSFAVDRDAVTVRWSAGSYVIPLDALAYDRAEDPSLAEIKFGAGTRDQQVVLQTGQARYVLAVDNADSFMREVQARIKLGGVRARSEGAVYKRGWLRRMGADPIVRIGSSCALALTLALWALVAWRFQYLPVTLVARFDPLGGPAGTRGRDFVVFLASLHTVMLAGDAALALALYRRTPVAAQLLLLLGAFVALLMAIALAMILLTAA
jgi:hypothetical protein